MANPKSRISRFRSALRVFLKELLVIQALIFLPGVSSQCKGSISTMEYNALYSLFNATAGWNWLWESDTILYGQPWVFDTSEISTVMNLQTTSESYLSEPCTEPWQGLICGELAVGSCYIQEISLDSYNLQGELPSQLEDFQQLEVLDLGDNKLVGRVPVSLGNASKLEVLALNENLLTGSLPYTLSNLRLLEALYLYSNYLSGSIPSSYGNLTALIQLAIYTNSITGPIPSELGNLESVTGFYVDSNLLTGSIPLSLCNAVKTLSLNLDINYLSGTVPSCLRNLENLVYFWLYSNVLSGTIPSSLGNFKYLQMFYLHDNLLTGIVPSSLGNLNSLNYLYLYNNALTGRVPSSLCQLQLLLSLLLSYNQLTGTIPSELGKLVSIQYFFIQENMLSGPIPSSLGNEISKLAAIILSDNFLTGTIPSSLGNLPVFKTLELDSNLLTGTIPYLAHIEFLLLSNNSLTGSITSFSSSFSLEELYLGFNYLTGSIGNLTSRLTDKLSVLSLEGNHITGTLTQDINITGLSQLLLNNNSISGSLPSSLSRLSALEVLLLQYNHFTGKPDLAFNATAQTLLSTVDLSFNRFTGTIPSAVFGLPALKSFAAIQSCYSGPLPGSAICASSYLEYLFLDGVTSGSNCRKNIGFQVIAGTSGNPRAYISSKGIVSGGIPSCIWTLSSLKTLHLSGNGLTGTIATDIAFQNHSDINLSYNQLSGTIPLALQRIGFVSLDLSYNRLKGEFSSDISSTVNLISLCNNRLSGFVPNSFSDVSGEVNVMKGNLFDCNTQHPAPSNDAFSKQTFCGSDQFNYAAAASVLLFVVCIIVVIIVYHMLSRSEEPAISAPMDRPDGSQSSRIVDQTSCSFELEFKALLDRFCQVGSRCWSKVALAIWCWSSPVKTDGKNTDRDAELQNEPFEGCDGRLCYFTAFLENSLAFGVLLMSGITVCCLIAYPAIKLAANGVYSTHSNQYLWLVTSAFLQGTVPAVFTLGLYFLGLLASLALISRLPTASSHQSSSVQPKLTNPDDQVTSNYYNDLGDAVLILSTLTVLLLANLGYLYVILFSNQDKTIQTLAEIALAILKFVCNYTFMPTGTLARTSKMSSSLMWFKFMLNAFNYVLAPCLMSVIANSQCLFDLFAPTAVIVENFDYSLASKESCFNLSIIEPQYNNDDTNPHPSTPIPSSCYTYSSPTTFINIFYPAFTYSYQCGSSIITNYVPVLVYSFTLQAIATLVFGVLQLYFLSVDKGEYEERKGMIGRGLKLIGSRMIGIMRPVSTTKCRQSLLPSANISASIMQTLLVMLTFGLSSPLLAAVLLTAFAMDIATILASMKFYLEVSPRCKWPASRNAIPGTAVSNKTIERAADPTGGLDEACTLSFWAPHSLCYPVMLISSCFWGLMVFDMVGNTVVADPIRAVWAPVAAAAVPLVAGTAVLCLQWKMPDKNTVVDSCELGIEGRQSSSFRSTEADGTRLTERFLRCDTTDDL